MIKPYQRTPHNISVNISLHITITYHAQYSFQFSLIFQYAFSQFSPMFTTSPICSRNWGCKSCGNPRYYKVLVEE
jgi:hypothetical protein